ncbi:hypothetical protein CEE69_04355 [Rhodopirellula bahusiensis]|uniref:Uncharacterized protein n=1 Tax=Rhodopirellula bahusiensis TaxID=2014065 RepID=A0A2G1WC40_9BACT|nr:hypothetical protein CEE69_04355 [Rhodopirellula bahusiensis]
MPLQRVQSNQTTLSLRTIMGGRSALTAAHRPRKPVLQVVGCRHEADRSRLTQFSCRFPANPPLIATVW